MSYQSGRVTGTADSEKSAIGKRCRVLFLRYAELTLLLSADKIKRADDNDVY